MSKLFICCGKKSSNKSRVTVELEEQKLRVTPGIHRLRPMGTFDHSKVKKKEHQHQPRQIKRSKTQDSLLERKVIKAYVFPRNRENPN